MSGTHGAFYADTAHGGGFIFWDPSQITQTGTAATLTRTAGPPIVLNLALGNTATTFFNTGIDLQKRLLEFPSKYPKMQLPHEELFGTNVPVGSGVNVNQGGWVEGAPGFPPFTGATQLTAPTADPPKGVQLLDVVVYCLISTANPSTFTVGVYRNVFVDSVAIAQATLLAATSLITAAPFQATPHVIKTPIAAAPFEITDNSDIFVDLAVVTTGSGTLALYGIGVHYNFNYD